MPAAILSAYNKTGLADFARGLQALGWQLIASGGTARLLRLEGLPVTDIPGYSSSTGVLRGRVRALHPAIHGGLLARNLDADRQELLSLGWEFIDLAAVNLYPFEELLARGEAIPEEIIDAIDIGGVALIRAAAKNHARVTAVCDPADYNLVLAELQAGGVSQATRRRLAAKAFALTARYDSAIAAHLHGEAPVQINAYPVQQLRYGENPHQTATLYAYTPGVGPLGGRILQGKDLSYNNLLDLDAAWRAVVSFEAPAVCITRQLSPCGLASAPRLADAYLAALECDPLSAYGGVIAVNRTFDVETARAVGDLFVECLAAPGFTLEALQVLAQRKNCRVVEMPDMRLEPAFELRSITRGLLRQDLDQGDPPGSVWKVVSRRQPTDMEWEALRFAWKACQHVRSNAVVLARPPEHGTGGQATVGIGGGQPNRLDCVRLATVRAGERARGAVMASDAFFPFPDAVTMAARAGVTAIVHPGGSVRDGEITIAADALGMALALTGVRHFRH